jgi:RNA recognition motif-containing protein
MQKIEKVAVRTARKLCLQQQQQQPPPPPPSAPEVSLFCSNLEWDTDSSQLERHIQKVLGQRAAGAKVAVLRTRTGVSLGCAAIRFQTAGVAQHAALALQGSSLDGRALEVRHGDR